MDKFFNLNLAFTNNMANLFKPLADSKAKHAGLRFWIILWILNMQVIPKYDIINISQYVRYELGNQCKEIGSQTKSTTY